MMRILILIWTVFNAANTYAQTFDKVYASNWADTYWKFEFFKNGTYRRTSFGHYGNTIVSGEYKNDGDTINLITGFENTHGTVNKQYLIAKDSCIIDLTLKYYYCKPIPNKDGTETKYWEYWQPSKKRRIMFPQLPTNNSEVKIQVESILKQIIDWVELEKFYHVNNTPNRKPLVIKDYFQIKANNGINLTKFGQAVLFKSEEEIMRDKTKAFIEIVDFNISSESISTEIRYEVEGISALIYFYKDSNGTWTMSQRSKLFEH